MIVLLWRPDPKRECAMASLCARHLSGPRPGELLTMRTHTFVFCTDAHSTIWQPVTNQYHKVSLNIAILCVIILLVDVLHSWASLLAWPASCTVCAGKEKCCLCQAYTQDPNRIMGEQWLWAMATTSILNGPLAAKDGLCKNSKTSDHPSLMGQASWSTMWGPRSCACSCLACVD